MRRILRKCLDRGEYFRLIMRTRRRSFAREHLDEHEEIPEHPRQAIYRGWPRLSKIARGLCAVRDRRHDPASKTPQILVAVAVGGTGIPQR